MAKRYAALVDGGRCTYDQAQSELLLRRCGAGFERLDEAMEEAAGLLVDALTRREFAAAGRPAPNWALTKRPGLPNATVLAVFR